MDPELHQAARRQFWDMAFCSLLGMNHHPGTTRDKAQPASLVELAQIADEALQLRDKRFGECHGL